MFNFVQHLKNQKCSFPKKYQGDFQKRFQELNTTLKMSKYVFFSFLKLTLVLPWQKKKS